MYNTMCIDSYGDNSNKVYVSRINRDPTVLENVVVVSGFSNMCNWI